MTRFLFRAVAVASLLLSRSLALQVTPNSKCADVCMDDAKQDKSDPNVSNTKGSDIVCRDENYGTPVGQKFEECITCLRNSTAATPTENDLQWLLYNLRYAVSSCIYGLHNASDPLSSPCSIQTSCGPLVGAIQDGLDTPLASNRYSYCTAFDGSFMGPRLGPCTRCLTLTSEQKYMGNFFVALKAGCVQKPEPGTLLGLDGDLFSKTLVNITDPIVATPVATVPKGGLSTGAMVGIGIAGAVVLIAFLASLYIGYRKREARRKRDGLMASGLDDRYGNSKITPPVQGAYSDPHPPEPSPYQGFGLSQASSKSQTSIWSRNQPQTREHRPSPLYPHPSPQSHQIEMSRGMRAPSPYTPGQMDPAPAYSPPMWTPPGLTHSPHNPSPTSTAHSRTHLRSSSSTGESHHTITPKSVSPMMCSGLPKASPPILPKRSNSNATAMSSHTVRPGPVRHTRDLSVSRGAHEDSAAAVPAISGPIITVNTRFDEEEEARRKRERERLYRMGFKAKPEERGSPASEEMWPGNY